MIFVSKKQLKKKMISVIIPSYNHAEYILKCIDSVLSQTYTDWQLIVVDDGSNDDSNTIIAKYHDKRIIHIKQENYGAHNAINKGLSLATGDYLTILNSDDEYHPERFEICMNTFIKDPDVDFISTWINIVDDKSNIMGVKEAWSNMLPWEIKNKKLTFLESNDYCLNALMANFVATTSNMIFKRKVYDQIGGMRNLRFAHDWDYLLRVCSKFNCFNLQQALLSYRVHGANTISSNKKWMLFEICWVIAANIDKFSEKLISDSSTDNLIKSSINILESINFQGNDKVFWLLYIQITTMKKLGILNPEEIYLEDKSLREEIINYIKI
jgi:glycosyltransferase involved in cell wall biosynthesis